VTLLQNPYFIVPLIAWAIAQASKVIIDSVVLHRLSGHLLEMMPYWAAKLQQLVADPQAPVVRALDAPERLGGVVNGETLTPAAGAEALRRTAAEAAAVLRALPATAWVQPIEHPRFGAVMLAVLTQNVLVGHAGDHVRHIAATLHATG